jgi:hypothetical protein
MLNIPRRRQSHVAGAFLVALATIATLVASVASAQTRIDSTGASGPTFTKDVLPIFQRSCQNCHRPGQVAPFSLMTYESARPWARAIKANVVSRYMPPWHIDRHVGEYEDDPSLSDLEVSTIADWVDAGAPRGNPADAPPDRQFASADVWVFGDEPDLVVTAPAVRVEAEGADTYPELETTTNLTEDRYIKWMQVVPEHPGALHHTMVYANQASSAAGPLVGIDAPRIAGALSNGMQSTLLVLFAGGGAAGIQFPEGQGKLLQTGAVLRFAHHFHTTGEALSERTKIAFKFFPKGYTPTHLISTIAIGNRPRPTLAIPPGDPNARGDGYFLLQKPARLVSFQPHMHYRGKRMLLEAILPNGESVLLTDANHFRWTWQLTYRYKNPPTFPTGTVLHITSYHDNSVANRDNPDPTAFVSWGERTVDEMNNGWVDFYYLSDDEYAAFKQQPGRR